MRNDLRFFQAGMPSTDGDGLAGFDGLGQTPSDEFVPAVTEEGAWPAGSGPTDIFAALPGGEQDQVSALVRQGWGLYDAIARVTGGTPSGYSMTASGAPIGARTNWTPLLVVGGLMLFLLRGFGRKR